VPRRRVRRGGTAPRLRAAEAALVAIVHRRHPEPLKINNRPCPVQKQTSM